MEDKELVMKLEEDISWLEQGCTTEKEICEHIKQAIKNIIQHKETENPWHTGTPTEEGDYLCWVKGSFGIKHGLYYNRCKYKDGNWFDDEVTNYNLKDMRFQVIAWQKIEPYKED